MTRQPILLYAVVLLFCSCSSPRYIYNAAPANVPYFTEKGDAKLSVLYSGGSDRSSISEVTPRNRGVNLQGAYAISRHWAITTTYQFCSERDGFAYPATNFFNSSVVTYRRHMTDIGAGYFNHFGTSGPGYGAIYFGIGKGNFSLRDQGLDTASADYSRELSANVTKVFVQPTLYFTSGGHFSGSFQTRFSFVQFGKITTNYTEEEKAHFNFNRMRNTGFLYFEPGINLRYLIPGAEWLGVEGTLNFCTNPYNQVKNIRSRGATAGIGLTFAIDKMKK